MIFFTKNTYNFSDFITEDENESIRFIYENVQKVADLLKAPKLLLESLLCERTEKLAVLNHVVA